MAMAIYTGKAGIPTDNDKLKSSFAWSFLIGWLGWCLSVVAGLLCFLIPDEFDKKASKAQV